MRLRSKEYGAFSKTNNLKRAKANDKTDRDYSFAKLEAGLHLWSEENEAICAI